MAAQTIGEGKLIIPEGQALGHLYLITAGNVHASFPGGDYYLEKGDFIGLMECHFDSHFISYTTASLTSIMPYQYSPAHTEQLLKKHPELTEHLIKSMFRQMHEILDQYELQTFGCNNFYSYLKESYDEYVSLCNTYKITPRVLPGLDEIAPITLEDDINDWMSGYYEGIEKLMTESVSDVAKDPNFIAGLMQKCSLDTHAILRVCNEMYEYKNDLATNLMNENRLDFFDLYSSLYFRIGKNKEHSTSITASIGTMMIQLEAQSAISHTMYKARVAEYKQRLADMDSLPDDGVINPQAAANSQNVMGSLETILEYADCPPDVSDEFRQAVFTYRELVDKNSSEPQVAQLRQHITQLFFEVYTQAFQVSLTDEKVPTVVKMFFLFGYVDENLIGIENASYLYSIADSVRSYPEQHIYTLYDWLRAIYTGQKEPSRNEFDTDYTDYLRELKANGKISSQEEAELLKNNGQKVIFELQNMVPVVNKMTYGRITTYCPLLSEHDVIKPLDSILVQKEAITSAIDMIRTTDYSAFYRETIFSAPKLGINKEYIHVEVLPDFILFPNIGIRGVMWQEIEGKKRTTPSRMMLSIFELEDISNTILRLTGEYRWEMCKRVQGARWNDVTDRSLTSEYFDYVQFYKKNRDLSSDAKEKVHTMLTKCKNSFREMFLRDYMVWVMFEGKGSPRLNKVARSILFTYCPFSAKVRMSLANNPLYADVLNRYKIKNGQAQHQLKNVFVKIANQGKPIPEELDAEKYYLQK